MRRSVILLLVFGLVQLMRPLGSSGYGAEALLTFGFLILAAYTVGEIAEAFHGPKIVGYLVAGAIFGPFGLQVASHEALARLEPVSDLAIALIAFLAGAELRWSEVRERGIQLLKVMGVELTFGFLAIAILLFAAQSMIPFLRGVPAVHVLAFVLLFASVAIVHSPAVTMALLTETGARGPVARTTLGVVLITDVVVVVLFTAMLALSRSLVPATGQAVTAGVMVWEILGAILVGTLLGAATALYLRFVGEELFLFAILVTFLGSEIAQLAHVERLLTLLTAGFVTENISRDGRGDALRHAMERSAAPVFVVFFALSGAAVDLASVASLLVLVVPLALVRALAIWGGTRIGARWAGLSKPEQDYTWLGLISQAGVAIGLATFVADSFPNFGDEFRTLLLALIAVNQLVGPILFRRALVMGGEMQSEDAPRTSMRVSAGNS